MVRIDLNGHVVELPVPVLEALRDAAAADAARSSARRDLSLILERALQTGATVALRRAEARELRSLIAQAPAASPELEAARALLADAEP